MVWASRQTTIDDYAKVLDGFSTQWQRLGSPKGMMLLSKREGDTPVRLYVKVSDRQLLEAFPGFEITDEPEASLSITFEDGDTYGFSERLMSPR